MTIEMSRMTKTMRKGMLHFLLLVLWFSSLDEELHIQKWAKYFA